MKNVIMTKKDDMEAQIVMSKFLRVKMSPIIRNLIESLPSTILEEVRTMTSIYTATGNFIIDNKANPLSITIWTDKPRSIIIIVKINDFNLELPFNNEVEQQTVATLAKREILNCMN